MKPFEELAIALKRLLNKRLRLPLVWQVFSLSVIMVLVIASLASFYLTRSYRQIYMDTTTINMQSSARFIASRLGREFVSLDTSFLDRLVEELNLGPLTRVTIISPSGTVLSDTFDHPINIGPMVGNPEFESAKSVSVVTPTRFYSQDSLGHLALGAPIRRNKSLLAVVRLEVSLKELDGLMRSYYQKMAITVGLITLLTGLLSVILARRLSRPLQQLMDGAHAFGQGDLSDLDSDQFAVPEGSELETLATSLNRMGKQIQEQVSRLRKLEKMRKEFVANVSHELKTPITLVKGFSETLLEQEGLSDAEQKKFLGIISNHSDRLQSIIQDLLMLSRIEQEEDGHSFETQWLPLKPVIERAMATCEPKASAGNVELTLEAPESCMAAMNAPLMEQALVNLIDNAIKYSQAQDTVRVSAAITEGSVTIAVRDEGPGIPDAHLKYLFQRFYRVDKGRSREVGGTGLGLAIVKHIAQAHGGHVDVSSTMDVGSTFSITIPLNAPIS